MTKPEIAVLGDGGWGTTLAVLLAKKGLKVTLWGAFPEYIAHLKRKRVNTKFLPGIRIPAGVAFTDDLNYALSAKDLVIIAVPSQYLRSVLKKIKRINYPRKAVYLSVTKGIEIETLKTMSEIIHDELKNVKVAALSGPTIAREVALGLPTTAVAASSDARVRRYLQEIFTTERFRIYANSDVCGVELGGSLKNVIAIACGISDGLGFGTNSKAALLARGLAEIIRLGARMGARPDTFSGISGLGDLVTTCISSDSRNRFVGEQIGKGKSLKQITQKMQMVAEGVPTAKAAYGLSLKYKTEMPITKEIYRVLYQNKSPHQAVRDLMTREMREE